MKYSKKILSIALTITFILSGLSVLGSTYSPPNNHEANQGAHSQTLSSYPLDNYVSLWVRRNGSDPGFPYGGANVTPSFGMNYFGTQTVQIGPYSGIYSYVELANDSLFPAGSKIYVGIEAGAAGITDASGVATAALTDSKIMGAYIDDFPVGRQSHANMSALYTALHANDAILGRSLKLCLVVYEYNYYKQSPYSWASIATDYDIIHFWFYPTSYGLLQPDFSGFEDAARDMHAIAPLKDIWIGIYLHYYNAGINNNSYPFDLTFRQMGIACRLIREGVASHVSILENFWIQHNTQTAWLVRNYLYDQFLPDYSTTWDIGAGTVQSYTGSAPLASPLIEQYGSYGANNYTLVSDVLQSITVVGLTGTHFKAWNLRTGEIYYMTISGDQGTFQAEPGENYRIMDMPLSPVTYNGHHDITTPTSWDNKLVTINGWLVISNKLWINNSIVQFTPTGSYSDTMFNNTTPQHGLTMNLTANAKLYITSSSLEPMLRNFPYFFNTSYSGGSASRYLVITNSTVACYAGLLRPMGYTYLTDSTFYEAMPDGGSHFGVWAAFGGVNFIFITRCLIWNGITPGSVGLFVQPLIAMLYDALKVDDCTIAGGAVGLWIDTNQHPGTFNRDAIFSSSAGADSAYVRAQSDSTTDNNEMTITAPLHLSSDVAITGLLKSSAGIVIASFTNSGTYFSAGVEDMRLGAIVHESAPYPWTFTVTSGLGTSHYYLAADHALYHNKSFAWAVPRFLPFNNSVIVIDSGMEQGIHIYEVDHKLRYGIVNYVSSTNSLTLKDQGLAWAQATYPILAPAEVNISVAISAGVATVTSATVDYAGSVLANWTMEASAGSATFQLYGFPNGIYQVKVDGSVVIDSVTAAGGNLTFTYDGPWSSHVFTVEPTMLQGVMGMIWTIIPVMIVLVIISGMMGIFIGTGGKSRK